MPDEEGFFRVENVDGDLIYVHKDDLLLVTENEDESNEDDSDSEEESSDDEEDNPTGQFGYDPLLPGWQQPQYLAWLATMRPKD